MILHVAPRYAPLPHGGAEHQLSKLAPRLAEKGLDVAILTWDAGRRELPAYEEIGGVPVHRLRERSVPLGRTRRLPGLSMAAGLLRFLLPRRREVKFVHVHAFTELSACAALACYLLGIPCAAKATSVGEIERGVRTRWGPIGPLLWRCMTRLGWVVAMSSHVRSRLEAAGVPRERILHLGNGVEAPAAPAPATKRPSEEVRIAAASSLTPKKSLDVLIKAARIVAGELPGARWVIAGDGPQKPPLEKLAAEEGVADRVSWLGYREDVGPVLSEADVFVHASADEGVSNSVLEAMSAGKAVVVRRAGFNDELVEDGKTGLTFDGTPGELARAVLRLAEDPKLRRALGERARETVLSRFSFESVCAQYLAMLEKIGVPTGVPGRST